MSIYIFILYLCTLSTSLNTHYTNIYIKYLHKIFRAPFGASVCSYGYIHNIKYAALHTFGIPTAYLIKFKYQSNGKLMLSSTFTKP